MRTINRTLRPGALLVLSGLANIGCGGEPISAGGAGIGGDAAGGHGGNAGGDGRFTAVQLTEDNAEALLFGGTDVTGGIGDWYLTNGVVELIVDDPRPQDDLVELLGESAPPRQNHLAVSGGNIVDLGLVGEDNDQLPALFQGTGLNSRNLVRYESVSAAVGESSASITVRGHPTNLPVDPTEVSIATTYTLSDSNPFVELTTEVRNDSAQSVFELGIVRDTFFWARIAIVPFSPMVDRGFDHVPLDIDNPVASVETMPFAVGPGNISPDDGMMDPVTGRPAGEVSYGLLGVDVSLDPDGDGPMGARVEVQDAVFGVSSIASTSLGNTSVGAVPPGGKMTYRRRIYVGGRNEVASAANPILLELAERHGFAVGRVRVAPESTSPGVRASVLVTRTGGSDNALFPPGTPVTHFYTDDAGAPEGIVLPEGTYELEFRAEERDPVLVRDVVVNADEETVVEAPSLSAVGLVELTLLERSEEGEAPVPGRVTIRGIDGTSDPRLGFDYEAWQLAADGARELEVFTENYAGGFQVHNFVVLPHGAATVELRPGTYELLASRGVEFSLSRRIVTVSPGGTHEVVLVVERQYDTPDAMAGEFHIHTARGFDSQAPLTARVASFAAEGVEVLVATEHEHVLDLGPVIAEVGLEDYLASMVGQEATSGQPNPPLFENGVGHMNAWPLAVEPLQPGDGRIQKDYVAMNMLISRYRRRGAEVVQLNHPRTFGQGFVLLGVLDSIGYDPDLPIDSPPNDTLLSRDVTGSSGVDNPDGFRNLDFDVMEIANRQDVGEYLAARRDWLSFLNQVNHATVSGPVPFIPATAVSDAHHVTFEQNTEIDNPTGMPGYWRTYVHGVGDDPGMFDADVFNEAVKGGRMMGTNGPHITFRITDSAGGEASLGETLATTDDEVTLELTIRAANWVPVQEVRVIANGYVVMSFDAESTPAVLQPSVDPWSSSTDEVIRFHEVLQASVPGDAYFIVEAGAKLDPIPEPGGFYTAIVPGAVPIAFTNPIFVDADGEGFVGPGLPVMASATGAGELRPQFAQVHQTNMSVQERVRRWWSALVASVEEPMLKPSFVPVPSRLTSLDEHRGGCGHVHYELPRSLLMRGQE